MSEPARPHTSFALTPQTSARMEPHIVSSAETFGWIEVICGSMFSGKTEELIRRLRRAQIARQRVEIFKPALDNRYSADEVVSHDERVIHSTPVDTADQILLLEGGANVIGVDEAQFFGLSLVNVCQILARQGRRVVVAGLDQDYRGEPFEPIPQLMAVAEYVTKLHAICMRCGAPANHSQRITASEERVVVGAGDHYEPRCRRCFIPPSTKKVENSPSGAHEKAPAVDGKPRNITSSSHREPNERAADQQSTGSSI